MNSGFTCSRIVPTYGLSEEQALMYMKLRQVGCTQDKARRFCSRNFCQIDQTQKRVGPANFEVFRPKTNPLFGHNGWESSLTVHYDMGPKFRLSKDLEVQEGQVERLVQQRYLEKQAQYENQLKQQIKEFKEYIKDESMPNASVRSRHQLLQDIKLKVKQLKAENTLPRKYLKHNGMKFHHLLKEVENTANLPLKICQPKPIKSPEQMISPHRTRNSIEFHLVKIETVLETPASLATTPSANHTNMNMESSHIAETEDLPIQPQKALRDVKSQLEALVQPFSPNYPVTPNDSQIIVKTIFHTKRPAKPYHSYLSSISRMDAESNLILSLLHQNGISDTFDPQALIRSQSQPQVPAQNNSKLKMASDFNQTQYLFKSSGYKPGKNVHLVFRNLSRSGQIINDISLEKSRLKKPTPTCNNSRIRGSSITPSNNESVLHLKNLTNIGDLLNEQFSICRQSKLSVDDTQLKIMQQLRRERHRSQ